MEWIVMAVIWGGLLLYFIIPFHENADKHQHKKTIKQAVISSFKRVTGQKKMILAVSFLLLTYLAIWYSAKDLAWYNQAHGVTAAADPAGKVPIYLAGVTIYALLLYLTVVGRQALLYMESED